MSLTFYVEKPGAKLQMKKMTEEGRWVRFETNLSALRKEYIALRDQYLDQLGLNKLTPSITIKFDSWWDEHYKPIA